MSEWRPDEGIWDVRGPRRHFTRSRVVGWVAFDRAATAVEQVGLSGELERWRRLRATVHAQMCREGFDAERNCFVQHYGSKNLDARVLMIPLVRFLPCSFWLADNLAMVGPPARASSLRVKHVANLPE